MSTQTLRHIFRRHPVCFPYWTNNKIFSLPPRLDVFFISLSTFFLWPEWLCVVRHLTRWAPLDPPIVWTWQDDTSVISWSPLLLNITAYLITPGDHTSSSSPVPSWPLVPMPQLNIIIIITITITITIITTIIIILLGKPLLKKSVTFFTLGSDPPIFRKV